MNQNDDEKLRRRIHAAHSSFGIPATAFQNDWAAAQRRLKAPTPWGWLRPALGTALAIVVMFSAITWRQVRNTPPEPASLGDLFEPSDALLDDQKLSYHSGTSRLLDDDFDDSDDFTFKGDI